MYVQVAICLASSTKRIYTHWTNRARGRKRERKEPTYVLELVWPPALGLTPTVGHPSASPRSICPSPLLPPFCPHSQPPTTPAFSSGVHRSPPITRTCHLASSSPWKPESLDISSAGLSPARYNISRFLVHGFSAGFREAWSTLSLFLLPPSWAPLWNFPSKLTSAIMVTPDVTAASSSLWSSLSCVFFPFSASLHAIRAEREHRLLSDVLVFALFPN